ncbi:MAG: helix-hairpin-helix domain-containing protein [Cyclobacteriaceae bacterium]|jgi:DNA uptake protein ComE-like DNA-binding protein|nr:helix-hairpin-helix domain-containing protein [Cyclobacteriaceae bacterium]
MKKLKRLLEMSFGFSAKEANGFMVMILINLMLFGLLLTKPWLLWANNTYEEEQKKLEALRLAWEQRIVQDSVLFWQSIKPFSVYETTQQQWEKFGFAPGLAKRITNLSKKPNAIKNFESFLGIYGMDSSIAQTLKPYIIFNETKSTLKNTPINQSYKQVKRYDLNQADTTQLKTVYGIGSKLANRIVAYRQQLGGFVNEAQVLEVYRIDTTAVERIFKTFYITENFEPNKIDINKASISDLMAHPYINFKMAQAIFNYRKQHGFYKNAGDLVLVKVLSEKEIEKLKPYLSFEE